MSYEKHTWETGETITAEKLNHLETGIENLPSGGGNEPFFVEVLMHLVEEGGGAYNYAPMSWTSYTEIMEQVNNGNYSIPAVLTWDDDDTVKDILHLIEIRSEGENVNGQLVFETVRPENGGYKTIDITSSNECYFNSDM